jgi:hypothetical protein
LSKPIGFWLAAVLAASRRLLLLSSPWSKQKLNGWPLATSRHPQLRDCSSKVSMAHVDLECSLRRLADGD